MGNNLLMNDKLLLNLDQSGILMINFSFQIREKVVLEKKV